MKRSSTRRASRIDIAGMRAAIGTWSPESYCRRFPSLPPFEPPEKSEAAKLHWFEQSALAILENASVRRAENPCIPAGYSHFGQFVAHDLSMTIPRQHPRQVAVVESVNARSPLLDLDSVYGGGPEQSPHLYECNASGRFLIGGMHDPLRQLLQRRPRALGMNLDPLLEPDLPRNYQGTALIADGRNDSTVMISQMHLALLLAHNRLVDEYRAKGRKMPFADARRSIVWHYQWVVANDYLRHILNASSFEWLEKSLRMIGRLPDHLRLDRAGREKKLPLEFVIAAFRFGHSMVRSSYSLNDRIREPVPLSPKSKHAPGARFLTGFRSLPENWTIDWRYFLDWQGGSAPECLQRSMVIDRSVTQEFESLPVQVRPAGFQGSPPLSTLLRGWIWGLPSGQAVAELLRLPVVGEQPEPLWIYVLHEAEEIENGERLGPVGSLLVSEVFLQLLSEDPESYFLLQPNWKPELPHRGREFRLFDLLSFAEVEPPQRP